MLSLKDSKLSDDVLCCACCLYLNSLSTGSFLTETVLQRFCPHLPSLCEELVGEYLPQDLPITSDLGVGTSIDIGCIFESSSVRTSLFVMVEIVVVGMLV